MWTFILHALQRCGLVKSCTWSSLWNPGLQNARGGEDGGKSCRVRGGGLRGFALTEQTCWFCLSWWCSFVTDESDDELLSDDESESFFSTITTTVTTIITTLFTIICKCQCHFVLIHRHSQLLWSRLPAGQNDDTCLVKMHDEDCQEQCAVDSLGSLENRSAGQVVLHSSWHDKSSRSFSLLFRVLVSLCSVENCGGYWSPTQVCGVPERDRRARR